MTPRTMALAQRPVLQMRATPALIASAQLLAVPAAELERIVERELAANPALERREAPPPAAATDDAIGRLADEPGVIRRAELDARAQLPPTDHAVLAFLVGSLDERGLLAIEPCPAMERARRALREAGPPGLGARDLEECLTWQLEDLDPPADERLATIAKRLVQGHLADLAAERFDRLAAEVGAPRDDVVAARDLIRERLVPYPMSGRAAGAPAPAPPAIADVIVRDEDSRLVVVIGEEERLGVRISPAAQDADARRAHGFAARLAQRWNTIRRVAEHVVARQEAFLRHGPPALVPLTRAEVAAALDLHESTVSRAVSGRHVLTPSGRLVPFRSFFGAAPGPKEVLRAMVASEPRPLSDAELAARLAERGHVLARRTVAKYRTALGILPHDLR